MKLQSEKEEWVLLATTGELVKVAAKKLHSKLEDNDITDNIPENSYIFSNTPSMKLNKKDFKNIIIDTDYPEYKEGQVPKEYKEYNFADTYFPKNSSKSTPAEIVKNIQRKHKVITSDDVEYNPYIQLANTFNKQNRQIPLEIIRTISEDIKPKEDNQEMNNQEMNNQIETISKFKMGGNVKNNINIPNGYNSKNKEYFINSKGNIVKYQDGGGVFGGVLSGAAAGAPLGPWGAAAGALLGGIGGFFTGKSADKKAKERERLLKKLNAKRQQTATDMTQASNLTTMAKAAVPLPTYDRLSLSDEISNINNTYEDIYAGYNQRKANAIANGLSAGNSVTRSLSNRLNSTQLQNLGANISSQAIQNANTIGQQYDSELDNLKLEQVSKVNPLSMTQKTNNLQLANLEKDQRYDKYSNTVNEFGTNKQTELSRVDSLNLDEYEMKRALELGNSEYRANAFGTLNNTLATAGSGASALRGYFNDKKDFEIISDGKGGLFKVYSSGVAIKIN